MIAQADQPARESVDGRAPHKLWACRVAHKNKQIPPFNILIEAGIDWTTEAIKTWLQSQYPNYISYQWREIDIKMSVTQPLLEMFEPDPWPTSIA
ncbi:hypothetical protein [Leptolyngbya sp. FACHB-261]|uniref:hypothetical protein n=1 Tax=Leptolyngbya sp. FACHB-261 TaxID=2692806 RepID=UPI0016830456|nr:hypothetical protein [Leptolyngbya sp. FACHB-261]MBD2105178.1 hypothetical protein [Leptolyngbya sp. FACHB-261]